MINCISKVFELRGVGTEKFANDRCSKCQFLAKSENCTSYMLVVYADWLLTMNPWYIYIQFGLSSEHSCNKNCTVPYFKILISNRANFAIHGPISLHLLHLKTSRFYFYRAWGHYCRLTMCAMLDREFNSQFLELNSHIVPDIHFH